MQSTNDRRKIKYLLEKKGYTSTIPSLCVNINEAFTHSFLIKTK
jgi:hypothetical protein